MKTTAVIAVRTGSSRLPDKALLPIMGESMMGRMIERIQHAPSIDEVMIATTELPGDDRLEAMARRLGVECYRGSTDDVLDRIAKAVAQAQPDRVVEMLGDNPLVHSDLIEDVIAFYDDGGFDYALNVTHGYPHAPPEAAKFPVGIRVEVFRPEVIARCAAEATDPYNHEHSTSYIGQHPELFKAGYFEATGAWAPLHRPDQTFAVNYRQNFDLVDAIFKACYPEDSNFSLTAAVEAYDSMPELASLMGEQGS